MSQDVPKCPYNSVYAILESRNKDKKKSIICCEHGKPCANAEKNRKKEETTPYVNLMKEGGQDRNACEVSNKNFDKLQELAARLREVEMNSTKKKAEKKEKKKEKTDKEKKKREMVRMEKIMNDAADLTFDEESRSKMDPEANELSEIDALSKAMFSLEASTDTSVSKKKKKDRKKAVEESSEISIFAPTSGESENRRLKKQKKQNDDRAVPVKAKYVEEGDTTRSMYLGAVSKSAAEKNLDKPAEFRIYHQVAKYKNLDDLPAAIKLFVVCKTDEGFRHDQIKQAFSPTGNTKLYVEKGEQSMMFRNLDELVSYYQVQSRVQPEDLLQ